MKLRRDVFQAISDPSRRAILVLVASQSMTAGAIASKFDTSRPTISKHLRLLTECELLRQEEKGREMFYHLNPPKMKEVSDWAEQFRQQWEVRFNQLDKVLTTMKKRRT